MLENLKNEFNNTTTTNGAPAFKSTKSNVMDMFALGGAFRNRSDEDVKELASKAFNENPLLAMKTLFYLRDIRGGQGERRFFKVVIKDWALHHKEELAKNLHLIPEFGRWDDMLVLLETGLKNQVVDIISKQLRSDLSSNGSISQMAKWLPSENASSKQTKKYARILIKELGLSQRQYRKSLSALRGKMNLVETNLTQKEYSNIEYDKIPSRAGLIYRNAFSRNDGKRYHEFIDKLSKGEVKVNAGTLYPHDIASKALESYRGVNSWGYGEELKEEEIKLLDAQWNSLPDFIGEKKENAIAVVDTSGSMNGTPMNVAVSLGIYLAERNKGVFHNHFITFSSYPELQEIVGGNIVEKVRNLSDSNWDGSTNIEAVLQKILDTATKNNISQDEMVAKIIIISDMQFNYMTDNNEAHIFKTMEQKFNEAGYTMPLLTFWNVNAMMSNTQFTMNEQGVELVSGFSPSLFKNVLGGISKTPYELMLEVIESERYELVTV